jgi:hypothetical protein
LTAIILTSRTLVKAQRGFYRYGSELQAASAGGHNQIAKQPLENGAVVNEL